LAEILFLATMETEIYFCDVNGISADPLTGGKAAV